MTENNKRAMERMLVKTAGHTHDDLSVYVAISRCGHITDGVSFEHGNRGSWVMDFADLERIYLANKQYREELAKEGVDAVRRGAK